MTVKTRFTLDTNILIYAVDRDAGMRHDDARTLIGQAAYADCVLTVQALAEFFHATTRKSLLSAELASQFVVDWLDVFPVAAADGDILIDAMGAVQGHGFSFWDAVLWATARAAGCATIVTEDMQHGQRLGGVEVLDPFRQDSHQRLAAILGK